MKKIIITISTIFITIICWCSVTFDFDGVMIERFTNKIAYLYTNCWSDIEWLQETMTPESIQSMDQTCAASIKAITKIKWKIEKLKWRIWNIEALNNLLAKIDEIINSLQNSKDQVSNLYERYTSNTDITEILNQVNWENLIENLEELSDVLKE